MRALEFSIRHLFRMWLGFPVMRKTQAGRIGCQTGPAAGAEILHIGMLAATWLGSHSLPSHELRGAMAQYLFKADIVKARPLSRLRNRGTDRDGLPSRVRQLFFNQHLLVRIPGRESPGIELPAEMLAQAARRGQQERTSFVISQAVEIRQHVGLGQAPCQAGPPARVGRTQVLFHDRHQPLRR